MTRASELFASISEVNQLVENRKSEDTSKLTDLTEKYNKLENIVEKSSGEINHLKTVINQQSSEISRLSNYNSQLVSRNNQLVSTISSRKFNETVQPVTNSNNDARELIEAVGGRRKILSMLHPDRVDESQKINATKQFQRAVSILDKYK
jgi:chromosome segregation ATPase